jgi:hypothetical protein
MERSDPTIHSFIVKVWLETAGPDNPSRAQGYITHIPGEERVYITSLDDVPAFILKKLGRIAFTANP